MSLVDPLFPAQTTPQTPTPATPDTGAPPTLDPRIGQFLDASQQLRANAASIPLPQYPRMSISQALVGIGGALATSGNPHAQFVANYMPALGQAIEQQYGNNERGWQVARQNLLDQAGFLQQRAAGLQQWQQDLYKAQMGVYGQQVRGVGAAQVRETGSPNPAVPSTPTVPAPDPSANRKALLQQQGIPDPAASQYLAGVSRLPDGDAATWVANQAMADQMVGQAAQVVSPSPGQSFDLGRALYTINSIGKAAQSLQSQIPALRAARMSLVGQLGAVDPESDAPHNLQAGIDQYDQAIQASGAQLDRLAGASKQISAEIAKRSGSFVAPPALPASSSPNPPLRGQISPAGSLGPGANAVNQANSRLQYVGGHDLGLPAPGGIVNPDGSPARGVDVLDRANQAVMTGRDPVSGAPVTRQQIIAQLAALGYTVK